MKLRRLSEDFQVEEIGGLPIRREGQFAAYRLRKTDWTTLDALSRLSRLWNVPRGDIQHAGLKDRHAVTTQWITIRRGPPRSLEDGNISVEYLGRSPRAIRADDIRANAFRLVLRSLDPQEITSAEMALPDVQANGIPNYFDDQRFGSWYGGHGFIAEFWIREDYESALRLALAEPHPDDNRVERRQKALLREHWHDWRKCKELLDRSHRRSLITYLADNPQDFQGAWERFDPDLRGLFLSAFQSDLWNRILDRWIFRNCRPEQLRDVPFKTGPLRFFHGLDAPQREALHGMEIPLPSARLKVVPEGLQETFREALAERGWTLERLKVRTPRDRFFATALRRAAIAVEGLSWRFADDELDVGRRKLSLDFSLPRGSYATILVKRLLSECEELK